MRIVWAVPCATVSRRSDGGYDAELVGMTDAVVDGLPSSVQFMIMIRLGAHRAAIPESCRMAFEVFAPDGDVVFRHACPATIQHPSPIAEEDEVFSDVPMPFVFQANSPGAHRLVMSIDGDQAAEIPLRIVLAG